MLEDKELNKRPIFTVDSFSSALDKCSQIRKEDSEGIYVIKILKSVSSGQFLFPFSNFCLIGEEASIEGDKYGKQLDEYQEEITTWKTPTLTVTGSNNLFIGLNIENKAGNPSKKGTSVALAVYGNENTFKECQISSTQDTLFLGPLPDDLSTRYLGFLDDKLTHIEGNRRNYFVSSHIKGSVDFIFGAGQGVFNDCVIESVEDGRMGVSYVTAPAHSLKDDFGFLFYKCSFISHQIFCQRVYLGRPWRDYGKCAFISCSYGEHIKEEGVSDWSNSSRRYLTARFSEYPLLKGREDWMKETSLEFYSDIIDKLNK